MLSVADLDVTKREILRGLLRGASQGDLAWAAQRAPEDMLTLGREALVDLDPELAGQLAPDDLRHVADYLLGRQSAGQAAGTWELLESSDAARRWAVWVRESLDDLYVGDAPALPGVDDGVAGPRQPRPSGGGRGRGGETLARGRAERTRRRTRSEVGQAVRIASSPYRPEAVQHHSEPEKDLRLPHFASPATRRSMYALLVLLLGAFVLTTLISVPEFRSAKVIVVDVPASADRPLRGLSVLVLLPPEVRRTLHKGQLLRVQLPDTDRRVSTHLKFIEPKILSQAEVRSRYQLDGSESNRVRGPSAVALAELRVPHGNLKREKFAGAVTKDADVRTGTTSVISLVF